jgi:beta-N-acetylhexosaminidase
VPLARTVRRILSITYADGGDLIAGRVFNQELRSAGLRVTAETVDSRTTQAELDRLRAAADSADVVIASAYVVPRASRGSIGASGEFPAFIEQLSAERKNLIAISFGNPYLVSTFPSVPAYMLAWGGAPVSQRAAARAVLGRAPISGRLPISIPPWFKVGDGVDRATTAPQAER